MRILLIFIPIVFFFGCSAHTNTAIRLSANQDKIAQYQDQLQDWKYIVHQDGWTEKNINKIAKWSRSYVKYVFEKEKNQVKPEENGYNLSLWEYLCADHWVTPKEFIHLKQFTGDCDDIGAFMWSTFKALDYPHEIRIVMYEIPFLNIGHVLVNVQLPGGKWKLLESTPMAGLEYVDRLFYKKIVEFDEDKIVTDNKFRSSSRCSAIVAWQYRVKEEGWY